MLITFALQQSVIPNASRQPQPAIPGVPVCSVGAPRPGQTIRPPLCRLCVLQTRASAVALVIEQTMSDVAYFWAYLIPAAVPDAMQ